MFNRIALFRSDRAVTRRALAEAVGVNPQTIGYLKRGDYKPSLELGMKIAAYFDVPVDLVFSFSPFLPPPTLRRAGEQSYAITSAAGPRIGNRLQRVVVWAASLMLCVAATPMLAIAERTALLPPAGDDAASGVNCLGRGPR